MEQRLDATYLRAGILERATAAGVVGLGLGMGVLLAAWGISILWSAHSAQAETGKKAVGAIGDTNRPVAAVSFDPVKIEPVRVIVQVEQVHTALQAGNPAGPTVTPAGDVIRREVTVFSTVSHDAGDVTAGWVYKDGTGGRPIHQFCYFSVGNGDGSTRRVNIASNGEPSLGLNPGLVPDLPQALAKCQWWQG
jgi:hypothetical protein